jgi:hypothetical protein
MKNLFVQNHTYDSLFLNLYVKQKKREEFIKPLEKNINRNSH